MGEMPVRQAKGTNGCHLWSLWELFSQSMCSWTVPHGVPGRSPVLVRRVPALHPETRTLQQDRNRNQLHALPGSRASVMDRKVPLPGPCSLFFI